MTVQASGWLDIFGENTFSILLIRPVKTKYSGESGFGINFGTCLVIRYTLLTTTRQYDARWLIEFPQPALRPVWPGPHYQGVQPHRQSSSRFCLYIKNELLVYTSRILHYNFLPKSAGQIPGILCWQSAILSLHPPYASARPIRHVITATYLASSPKLRPRQ